jgi:Ca2+ transporting ATPase
MEMPEEKFTKVFTFNSERKSMSTIIPLEGGGYRVYTKGASEIIMKKCSFIIGEGGKVEGFTTAQQDRLVQTVIEPMAKDGLRTISIAYKDYVQNKTEKNQVQLETGDENIFTR